MLKLKSVNYICEECGKKATLVHHLDKGKVNHTINNLIALCQKCHINIYHKDTWGCKNKYGKLSVEEIAGKVGCSVGTLSFHLTGKRKSLKFGSLIDKTMKNLK